MLEQLAAPVVFPVSLASVKDWVRETTTDSDAVLTFLLKAATARVETVTHRYVVYRPVREWFDCMRQYFELSAFPVLGITAFKYTDTAGVQQTLAAAGFILDKYRAAARITPPYAQYFQPSRATINAVSIQYDAGMLVPVTAIAANGTFTAPGHNKVAGDIVQLSTDGVAALGDALPVPFGANLTALSAYYVVNPAGDNFQLALQAGGAAIVATGGAIAAVRVFVGVLPDEILLAMRLMIDTWFRNRSSISPNQVWEMPHEGAAESLLSPFMARGF